MQVKNHTPEYSAGLCTACGNFTVGARRMQQAGGRLSRRTMRKELEAKGMTRKEADDYLTAHGFPKGQPVRRAK